MNTNAIKKDPSFPPCLNNLIQVIKDKRNPGFRLLLEVINCFQDHIKETFFDDLIPETVEYIGRSHQWFQCIHDNFSDQSPAVLTIEQITRSKALVTFVSMNTEEEASCVLIHKGTPTRQLTLLDFVWAVGEERFSDDARGFFQNWDLLDLCSSLVLETQGCEYEQNCLISLDPLGAAPHAHDDEQGR